MEVQRYEKPRKIFKSKEIMCKHKITLIFVNVQQDLEKHMEAFIKNIKFILILQCLEKQWVMDMQ